MTANKKRCNGQHERFYVPVFALDHMWLNAAQRAVPRKSIQILRTNRCHRTIDPVDTARCSRAICSIRLAYARDDLFHSHVHMLGSHCHFVREEAKGRLKCEFLQDIHYENIDGQTISLIRTFSCRKYHSHTRQLDPWIYRVDQLSNWRAMS